jgi:hypothetical protein
MKKRWGANTWLLIVLVTIIGLVGIDIGRRMFAGPVPVVPPEPVGGPPEFEVGDRVPEVTLPDETGKEQHLRDLIKRDTLLAFSCGCSQCEGYQVYLSKVFAKVKGETPEVVSINTTMPDSHEAWLRKTNLPQKFLYTQSLSSKDLKPFRGHPCPRAFRIAADDSVTWIGSSPANAPTPELLGVEVAREFGFRSPTDADKSKPLMPPVAIPRAPTPAAAAAGQDGHSPNDGHGHGPNDGHGHGPNDGHGH